MNVQVQKGEEHNDAEDACPHPIIGYGEVIKPKKEKVRVMVWNVKFIVQTNKIVSGSTYSSFGCDSQAFEILRADLRTLSKA